MLNTKIIRKPFPLPLIHDILQPVGAFSWATCLDLSMGYYAMVLSELARKYCVTCLPWGLHRYNMLPMGTKVATDVLQASISTISNDLENVVVYIDDIIILSLSSFEEHVQIVSEVLRLLEYKGMQVNPLKSFWAQDSVKYLGFVITRDGV